MSFSEGRDTAGRRIPSQGALNKKMFIKKMAGGVGRDWRERETDRERLRDGPPKRVVYYSETIRFDE